MLSSRGFKKYVVLKNKILALCVEISNAQNSSHYFLHQGATPNTLLIPVDEVNELLLFQD